MLFRVSYAGVASVFGTDPYIVEDAMSSDRSTEEFTWTEKEEKGVRWKLDKVIVPLTTFLYLLCFLDR